MRLRTRLGRLLTRAFLHSVVCLPIWAVIGYMIWLIRDVAIAARNAARLP